MMLRAALGFFTRLPIGSAPLPPTFRGVAVWLPVVGLIIGALVSLALGLAAQLLPASLCLRRGSLGCASSICTVWSHAGARRTRQSRKASRGLRKNWRKGTCPACSGLVRVTTSHSGSCRRNSWMM